MKSYFWGRYFKCQSENHTIAVIPAVCRSKEQRFSSVQLITDSGAWYFQYPYEEFERRCDKIRVGDNLFGNDGIRLKLSSNGVSAKGELKFGQASPIRYDIMGPFRYVPFLECRHSIISMKHSVHGRLTVNGEDLVFNNAWGYTEGDRGRSFPKRYAWSHCFFEDGSVFVSTADIPIAGMTFSGVICVVHFREKEYRLATYLGAKASIMNGKITVYQGGMKLTAELTQQNMYPLNAPVLGSMKRTIHESTSCRGAYSFEKDGKTLFSFVTDKASFEYQY